MARKVSRDSCHREVLRVKKWNTATPEQSLNVHPVLVLSCGLRATDINPDDPNHRRRVGVSTLYFQSISSFELYPQGLGEDHDMPAMLSRSGFTRSDVHCLYDRLDWLPIDQLATANPIMVQRSSVVVVTEVEHKRVVVADWKPRRDGTIPHWCQGVEVGVEQISYRPVHWCSLKGVERRWLREVW